MHQHTRSTIRLAGLTMTAPALASACGDDAIRDGVLTVEMSDVTDDGLPDEVQAGTRISATNDSANELHEFVTYRLPDGDDRPVDEIIADAEALLTSGPPVAVLLAPPGSDEQIPTVGDGTPAEPGRYAIPCAIPTAADPAEYFAAAATSDGPPQVAGGPPHFVQGMYGKIEFTA